MARLEQAIRRLETATVRLEAAARSAAAVKPLAADLANRLEESRRENDELARVAETVGERLDKAIGRLRVMLET